MAGLLLQGTMASDQGQLTAAIDASLSFESMEASALTEPPDEALDEVLLLLVGVDELHPAHRARAAAGARIQRVRVIMRSAYRVLRCPPREVAPPRGTVGAGA